MMDWILKSLKSTFCSGRQLSASKKDGTGCSPKEKRKNEFLPNENPTNSLEMREGGIYE
jgi:hypothetical protein